MTIQTGFHNSGRNYSWSLTRVVARRAWTVHVRSNLFITETKRTGISVRIIEVSVLEKLALYGFRSLRDQVNCP